MTDPVLDKAGKLYHFGYGAFSRKSSNPALTQEQIGTIDLVLLSHHQHKDNFDKAGRKFAKKVKRVITTLPGAKTLKNGVGLANWESLTIETPKVPGLKITATPAQHHPWWVPRFFAGSVIGFIIEWTGQQNGVLYITGDTVYFKGINQIARKFPRIHTAIVHLGAVQFPYLTGKGKYTFDVKSALKTLEVLKVERAIPVHYAGWSHFKQKDYATKAAFSNCQSRPKMLWLTPGLPAKLEV